MYYQIWEGGGWSSNMVTISLFAWRQQFILFKSWCFFHVKTKFATCTIKWEEGLTVEYKVAISFFASGNQAIQFADEEPWAWQAFKYTTNVPTSISWCQKTQPTAMISFLSSQKILRSLKAKFADCTIEWVWGGFKAPIYSGKFILFVGTTSNSFIVQDAFSERKAKFPLFITNKSWWQSWGCLVREFPSGSVSLLYHLIIYQCLSKQWCSGMKGW